ncbi:MAG: nitroreductase family protein [Dehalococcoidia bacterium]|nr:nitroreductase family protein [Dehalococcoidia bacterium]
MEVWAIDDGTKTEYHSGILVGPDDRLEEADMDLWEAVKGRKSIRHFTGDPVPDSDITRIIETAGLAPSGGNQQMWRFIAVCNKELRQKLRQAVCDKVDEMLEWPEVGEYAARLKSVKGYGTYFADAPVAIAVLTEPYKNPVDRILLPAHGLTYEQVHKLRGDPATQSVGAAIQTLCLAAYALGYGTVWMCGQNYAGAELEKLLPVPDGWRLCAMLALGVPAEDPAPRPRLPVSEILTIIH